MDPWAKEIIDFWRGIGPEGWYRADDAVDDEIRTRFGDLWEIAQQGGLADWAAEPESCLALVILLDQFPRNIFRNDPRSFASDGRALTVANWAIAHGIDARIEGPERQFFFTPLMHSEILTNQDRSVRLYLIHFGRGELLRHARAHREIIRRFGRFPYRNGPLGRDSTPEEVAFVEAGGYGKAFREIAA
jgi:uncharacterized protein (DUF924 family)